MTKENSKITIRYKDKDYEIDKKKEKQKVKPKGKDDGKEITVKDYEEGGFFSSHKCECSKDGTNFEKIDIKWGVKKHITIWGSLSIVAISAVVGIWLFLGNKKDSESEEVKS